LVKMKGERGKKIKHRKGNWIKSKGGKGKGNKRIGIRGK
jgi:hypothetical protein